MTFDPYAQDDDNDYYKEIVSDEDETWPPNNNRILGDAKFLEEPKGKAVKKNSVLCMA